MYIGRRCAVARRCCRPPSAGVDGARAARLFLDVVAASPYSKPFVEEAVPGRRGRRHGQRRWGRAASHDDGADARTPCTDGWLPACRDPRLPGQAAALRSLRSSVERGWTRKKVIHILRLSTSSRVACARIPGTVRASPIGRATDLQLIEGGPSSPSSTTVGDRAESRAAPLFFLPPRTDRFFFFCPPPAGSFRAPAFCVDDSHDTKMLAAGLTLRLEVRVRQLGRHAPVDERRPPPSLAATSARSGGSPPRRSTRPNEASVSARLCHARRAKVRVHVQVRPRLRINTNGRRRQLAEALRLMGPAARRTASRR